MKKNIIEIIIGSLAGLGAYFCNLNWEIIIIWIMLMLVDIITGVIKSFKNGNFCSHDMKVGMLKKVGEFFLLFALILGQRVAMLNGINVPVGTIFVGAFCFKELASVIENSIGMDIKIPAVIAKWFKVAKEQISEDKNEDKQ